jgi:hypothetical protein
MAHWKNAMKGREKTALSGPGEIKHWPHEEGGMPCKQRIPGLFPAR